MRQVTAQRASEPPGRAAAYRLRGRRALADRAEVKNPADLRPNPAQISNWTAQSAEELEWLRHEATLDARVRSGQGCGSKAGQRQRQLADWQAGAELARRCEVIIAGG